MAPACSSLRRACAIALLIYVPLATNAAPANDAVQGPKAGTENAYSDKELGDRLIALAENVRRKSDVSVKTVEKAMARKMVRDRSRQGVSFLTEKTQEGSAYKVEVDEARDVDRKLWITLDAGRQKTNAGRCILDLRRFHRAMERIGYEASRMVDHHGPGNRWLFAKRGIYIKAYYRSSAYYARGEDIRSENLCIESITIN
jgi:hypothetical protein